MNAIIRIALCAVLAAPLVVRAAEPATGNVLLIDYDRVIEGKIERVGDKFRIQQGAGAMSIPAAPGMVLLPSREAAYELVKSRARLGDPIQRARLARWCLTNHFHAEAVQEAEAALALQPDDRALKRFVEEIKTQVAMTPPPSGPAVAAPPKPAPPEPVAVDMNPEAFSLFVTKVQPLLMNACAQCHTGDRGGNFKLTRTAATFGDKRATQLNVAAVSPFLNRDQPSTSALLARAVSVHGDCARPPLRDRQAPAFKHLEEWARLVAGKAPTPPATLPGDIIAGAQPLTPEAPMAKQKDAPAVVPAKATEPATTAAPEPAKTEPSDPFDPTIFNKRNEKK